MKQKKQAKTYRGNSFPKAEETLSLDDVEEDRDHPHLRCTAGGMWDSGKENQDLHFCHGTV